MSNGARRRNFDQSLLEPCDTMFISDLATRDNRQSDILTPLSLRANCLALDATHSEWKKFAGKIWTEMTCSLDLLCPFTDGAHKWFVGSVTRREILELGRFVVVELHPSEGRRASAHSCIATVSSVTRIPIYRSRIECHLELVKHSVTLCNKFLYALKQYIKRHSTMQWSHNIGYLLCGSS